MDTLEKTIDWTPMTESPPPESDSYLVTRKDPLLTTTACMSTANGGTDHCANGRGRKV